ncbi:MAG: RimK family alpha-L-glutamate ligase [Clostridia bacterium]|nr:RimK family alpha-L-glutamate ligase [Clostridia bacterium]
MKGVLIVNGFLNGDKFYGIYELLVNAFKSRNVQLDIVKSSDVRGKDDLSFTPDFVMFWDKDYYLADKLERQGLKLFNSASGMIMCDNKILTYRELEKHGIAHPKTIVCPKTFENVGYNDLSFVDNAIEKLGLPIIIKEAYGSFGAQVYLAENSQKAKEIVNKIAPKEFVFQEFIKSSKGKDLRINVVGDKVVATVYRSNANDFRSNITLGGDKKPYQPSLEQQQTAINAVKALGLDFAGVDVMFGENDTPIVCEVNSNPHFKSTLECTGIDLALNIADYVIEKLC